MKLCCALLVVCGMLSGQILYEEYFTGGAMQLNWHPWFYDSLGIGDSMHVLNDPTTPGLDDWVGVISNEYMTVAGLTYAGASNLDDYSIEAYVYTVVTAAAGPYNGIAMRCNTDSGFYYRLVSDFDDSGRLRLGLFTGGTFPVVIRDWTGGEIPGGVPVSSSWHKLKMKMIADSIWAYYDDVMLPDCPFIDNSIPTGYFGVYTFNMAANDSTKCDNIIVTAEGTGVAEYGTRTPDFITVQPNPFTSVTKIRYSILDTRYLIGNTILSIYDAAGRLVKSLYPASSIPGIAPRSGAGQNQESDFLWDGSDAAGNLMAPGVYFITDGTGRQLEKIVKLR
jgi:hypothetical protein